MKLNTPSATLPYPTRGSPANTAASTRRPPGRPRRTRLASWLIVPTLLALTVAGTSPATAARSTKPRPASCSEATGARWHVKHFFYQYDSHGALTGARLPASGDRYTVSAGGIANCRLAHSWMRRLTSGQPAVSLGGKTLGGFFIPIGEGPILIDREHPRGFLCAASLAEKQPATEIGDNLHYGFCVTVSHKFAFIWTAATPSPYKLKPVVHPGGGDAFSRDNVARLATRRSVSSSFRTETRPSGDGDSVEPPSDDANH
jgi:hypothetical protein